MFVYFKNTATFQVFFLSIQRKKRTEWKSSRILRMINKLTDIILSEYLKTIFRWRNGLLLITFNLKSCSRSTSSNLNVIRRENCNAGSNRWKFNHDKIDESWCRNVHCKQFYQTLLCINIVMPLLFWISSNAVTICGVIIVDVAHVLVLRRQLICVWKDRNAQ